MLKIAICDDNSCFLDIFEKYVKVSFEKYSVGFSIYKYTTGTVLLDRHKSAPFDLIFLDIDMPEMTGFDVAEQFKNL